MYYSVYSVVDVIPATFVGVLSKDDEWLAQECSERGECAEGEALCGEARIRAAFAETRGRLEKEHVVREARTRFHH